MRSPLLILRQVFIPAFFSALLIGLTVNACQTKRTTTALKTISLPAKVADSLSQAIRNSVSAEVAEGLELTLWASDSLSPDPIALNIDDKGSVYVTRTNRQKNSEFDIRGHQDWINEAVSLRNVEERRAFLHKIFAPENSEKNNWLPDLNKDGSHDWKDLAVEKEQVFQIEDTDNDGLADVSRLVVEDFNDEITDVAGALLVHDGYMFIGVGPDVWRLKDADKDGVFEEKESISHGYAVHIGFSGHGMSGLTVGPDGKIWWGIGDIGSYVVDQEGKVWDQANEGAIFRANPDGSDFEVFCRGVRNTHEFTFDEYGNLITEDNDGDHPGESERLVYLVNGSDSGWRTNWQFGKYTDPNNNSYKVWMDEQLFKPRWEGQAAYILPPIRNYHNGPTGMKYNPGTALGERWKNHFFIVEFVGNAARSPLWAFQLEPEGASFAFGSEEKVLGGILPTGIDFGPDGALYIADWIEGWGTKNYGRIWKLDEPGAANTPVRQEVKTLMAEDFNKKAPEELGKLLGHADKRIRQKAQFALVKKGEKGLAVLKSATEQTENQLARVHAIWGISQMARQEASAAENLVPLLADTDPEIRAQAARWLGDVRYAPSAESIIPLLKDVSPRTQFFAAEALGRIGHEAAIQPIIEMLIANDDQDVYLRHAGACALARINKPAPIAALSSHSSRALRIAAVVALRRMKDPGVAGFLTDSDPYIVAEAARAINDDYSIEGAIPALAKSLDGTKLTSEPYLRRAINANLREGNADNLRILADYARRTDAPAAMRAEALATLASWPNPSIFDRVDGRNRGLTPRDAAPVRKVAEPVLKPLLADNTPVLKMAAADAAGRLKLTDMAPQILAIQKSDKDPEVRKSALAALVKMEYSEIGNAVQVALKDKDAEVRAAGLDIIPSLDIADDQKVNLLSLVVAGNSAPEQQSALSALGKLPAAATTSLLGDLLSKLEAGKVRPEIRLDLAEAIEASGNSELTTRLKAYQESHAGESPMEMYADALMGGNARRGGMVIYRNAAAQCMRCHIIRGNGGDVGPDLTQVGQRLSREAILQSIVDPSAVLAPGYGIVSLELSDGNKINGTLLGETPDMITVKTADAEPVKVPKNKIAQRTNVPSSMPPMGNVLSKRDIRDVVEFLSNLKEAPQVAQGHGE
ncbi:MAG: HEAT repeat domain-containing protein [Bacteroidia bacterium]